MKLKEINVYPVKGCMHVSVSEALCGRYGLAYDRRFAVVSAEKLQLRTQLQLPELARVRPTIEGNGLSLMWDDGSQISVPLEGICAPLEISNGSRSMRALDCGLAPAKWLGNKLRTDLRLVQLGTVPIASGSDCAGEVLDRHILSEGLPITVVCTASLAACGYSAETQACTRRFRSNLVIETDSPFVEDRWISSVRIGRFDFHMAGLRTLCAVINVNQATGRSDPDFLKRMAFLRGRGVDDEITFGVNLAPLRLGKIHVGDTVLAV